MGELEIMLHKIWGRIMKKVSQYKFYIITPLAYLILFKVVMLIMNMFDNYELNRIFL